MAWCKSAFRIAAGASQLDARALELVPAARGSPEGSCDMEASLLPVGVFTHENAGRFSKENRLMLNTHMYECKQTLYFTVLDNFQSCS